MKTNIALDRVLNIPRPCAPLVLAEQGNRRVSGGMMRAEIATRDGPVPPRGSHGSLPSPLLSVNRAGKLCPAQEGGSMAYTSRTDAWEVVCPNCGAGPGEKCVGARDRRRESVHRERMSAAAVALLHPPIATFRLDGQRLYDSEGNLIGQVSNVEFDLQSEALVGNLRRGEGEGAVEVLSSEDQPLSEHGSPEGDAQQALIADPVNEVWEHYQRVLDRPRAKLTPKVRRWINDAVRAVGVDECKRAIEGLAASEHHRLGGYTGIEYALKPKERETIEGRIAMMAAKAPQSPHDPTTVQSLIARLPSEVRPMVHSWVADVVAWLRSPDHRGLAATGEGRLRELREKAHMAPVIENGRIVRWEAVS